MHFVLFIAAFYSNFLYASSGGKDTLWELICRIPDKNSTLEVDIYEDDIFYAWNFKKKVSIFLNPINKPNIMVRGNSSSLAISDLYIHGMSSLVDIRAEWWSISNPQTLNSYYIYDYWNDEGEVSVSATRMNCKSNKNPKNSSYRTILLNRKIKNE